LRYIPHTDADVERMLRVVGVASMDELWRRIIPDDLRLKRPLELPPSLDEPTLMAHLHELAARNGTPRPLAPGSAGPLAFLGAGLHPHTIPAAVDMLLRRSEFYTSYTPYQPEVAQGTLQAVFEFQTMVAELTGLEIANASMYDGATACAEAVLMARRLTGRSHTVVAAGVHPEYVATCRTYLQALPGKLEVADDVLGKLADDVDCIVVQNPTFHGVVIDVEPIAAAAHARGALCVVVTTDPVAYAVVKPPGEAGADIAVSEGIGLALGSSLGGPGVGLFAARAEFARQMPGRLVGETVDKDGRRGYVLTLATREQHIRREKATSNICTNQGLVALAFTIHLSLLGKNGLAELARLVYAKTAYLKDAVATRLSRKGYSLLHPDRPHFGEVGLRVPGDASAIVGKALARGVIPGVDLGRFHSDDRDKLLVYVSEIHRREDIEQLLTVLEEVA
jgi:glycine dehydrogenase subunit 1